MKKIALISLICIYALSSFGFGIRQFYCCGQLKSTNISFLQELEQQCAKGDIKNDCCKTKYHVFKVKDSHCAADEVSTAGKHFADFHVTAALYEIAIVAIQPEHLANASHAPPFDSGIPIYKLFCVYRI